VNRPWTRDDLHSWIRFGSSSPLYTRLVETIGGDPELLEFLNRIEHAPRPNVLLAGVQYLLMKELTDPLAEHYPNIGAVGGPKGSLEDRLKDFIRRHDATLLEIGRTRYTQTNECRRCAVLLPVIWRTPLTRFHLVDVGTSAGLNLNLDRYHYRWGDLEWGPASTVNLDTENRGADLTPRAIDVASRKGLDLNPVDPGDADDRMWLEALVWPEHFERRRRLSAALDLAARHPVEVVAGDALETLGAVLGSLPSGEPVVVMHSFTLLQFTPEDRSSFREIVQGERGHRPVYEVSFDAVGRDDGSGALTIDDGSHPVEVGRAHPHGEWVELYALP
jgi:hypothetical protein